MDSLYWIVDTLKLFIYAWRTRDWKLHLAAVGTMLNLFAATGHSNYTKITWLYFQWILELPQKHPWLYKPFSEHGFHSVRRSDRHWAGLSTDLIIEQVMMRSIKSRSGLIRSPGFTETVRLMWLYSMHSCAQVHDAMTSLTDLAHRTSEQHVELTCTLEAGFRRYGRRIQLVLSAQPLWSMPGGTSMAIIWFDIV